MQTAITIAIMLNRPNKRETDISLSEEINPYISPFRVFNENFILVNSEVSFTVEPPDTYTVSAKFSFTPSTLEI